jgi:hypothetical protein
MDLAHYNKAIVAAVMAVIGLVNVVWNTGIVVDPQVVTAVVSALTPVLVWAIPNRP